MALKGPAVHQNIILRWGGIRRCPLACISPHLTGLRLRSSAAIGETGRCCASCGRDTCAATVPEQHRLRRHYSSIATMC